MNLDNLLKEITSIKENDIDDEISMPNVDVVKNIVNETKSVLFPGIYKDKTEVENDFKELVKNLNEQINIVIKDKEKSEQLVFDFVSKLPEIKKIIITDIEAIYNGDPAAKTKKEVMLCYPGFFAILTYRIAHLLRSLDIPYLPRMMSEYAHEKTGIDINPGAVIGESFCIDHGTGIVIGETSVIGHHVKLYQGVTIGAKSFKNDENGFPIKGGKRHPDIGDYVTIYANATILGGNTKIGSYSTIGGNVWITSSVPENTNLIYREYNNGLKE